MNEVDYSALFQHWRPPLPPVTTTGDGSPRRIGIELELIGLAVADVSRVVAAHIGGEIEEKSRYEHLVHGDAAGDWGVELDYEYLKRKGREDDAEDELVAFIEETAESLVRAGAEAVVPVEVVSPPLPMQRLGDVQSLIARLREAGAHGSGAGLSYAFGMQFNPELPSLDAGTIVDYLKAFFCLYDWLEKRSAPDFTRRLTRFTAPFPGSYMREVVDPGYAPDLVTLIDDYLAANPTRNRALDLLPLFLLLDEQRLRAAVDDPRVKPRPTLHYRLPNCEIDRANWGVHSAWLDWLQVEYLAADHERLQRLCGTYTEWLARPIGNLFGDWSTEVQSWLVEIENR
jgi:hypothetical protein